MTEKLKLKDVKQSLLRTYHGLRFSAMFLALALIVQLITPPEVFAQESGKHKVTGRVIGAMDNNSIPGANVIIKGTTMGTTTDMNGNFSIELNENDILIISYIGYVTEEVSVGTNTSIEVKLVEDISKLDEVVVIGYGTSKRKDITGAISSISHDDIRKAQPVTFEQALQAKVPGLVVQQISGQPGGAVSVQIRGVSSLNSNTGPLYVIDGIIIGATANLGGENGSNPMAGISPSDIETLDVLKDASATAIYGSQATNGVIVITTKKGKQGVPQISYEYYTGFQELSKKLSLMNLREYATFINERNTGLGWNFDARPEFANPRYLGAGTDWQDELFRKAPMSSHTVTVSGGDTKTHYLFSGSYFSQDGIALGSNFKRITARLNLDNQTTSWLKFGTNLQLANIKQNLNSSSSDVINAALSQTPDIAVTNADGSWGGAYNTAGWVTPVVNPVAIASINKDQTQRNQFFGNAFAEISFIKDLVLRNEVTASFSMETEDIFKPSYTMGNLVKENNEGEYKTAQNLNTAIRNYLTYSHVFANKYNTNIMVGHEAILNKSEDGSAKRTNFTSNDVQTINGGDPNTATNSGSKNHSSQESYFGRLNFGINDKYLLTANVRADGSSKFASGNQWVTTYSGALAWKINNENFLKNVKVINELKLRVGYGLTNNQGIPDYSYTSTLGTVATGLAGNAQITKTIGTPDLKWEKTKYANIGIDGSFFSGRLSFTIDFYDRRTNDLLMQTLLPMYTGMAVGYSPGSLQSPWVNIGDIDNKGFDYRVSTINIENKNFTWKTDLTVSRNINEVKKLNTDGASIKGTYSKTVVGGSIGAFYGYMVDGGVFATKDELLNHARPVKSDGITPVSVGAAGGSIWYGDLKFKDINGDGVINEKDMSFLGSPIPKFQIGLNNTFSFKNFDLNIFFTANYGNKVYNQQRVNLEDPIANFSYSKALTDYAKLVLNDPSGSASDIDNVHVSNPTTNIVGVRNDKTNDNNRTSDKFIEDGSFIRCKSISLGYSFSDRLIAKAHIKSLRIYVNVSNAFIITKYKGMDPEIGSWDAFNAGIDNGYYAQPRVYTIGANIAF
jgi:TonB-dependent starch-binding outer membrane protein SusC